METARRPTTEQIAAHLDEVGVQVGDRVAVHLPPGPARSAAVHACWQVGAVVVAFASGMRRRHHVAALDLVRPVVVVADKAGLRATRGCLSVRVYVAADTLTTLGQTVRETDGSPVGRRPDRDPAPRPTADADADADADAAIIFTRGEDGQATGVFYTRRDIAALRSALTVHLRSVDSARTGSGFPAGVVPRPTERCKTAPTLVEIVLRGLPAARHLNFTDARLLGTVWSLAAADRSASPRVAPREDRTGTWAVGLAHAQPGR